MTSIDKNPYIDDINAAFQKYINKSRKITLDYYQSPLEWAKHMSELQDEHKADLDRAEIVRDIVAAIRALEE